MISLKSVGQMSRMGGLVFLLLSVVEGSIPASAQTLTTLSSFSGSNGAYPAYVGLIADANGNLFGTTEEGGVSGHGTVFEVTSSGFVPPRQRQFAGTPGSADCTGKSISTLAQTYKGIAHAAPALGYANVTALQSAVA